MSYLKHYGVKGQKWGVRRGPPYPIEDTILPKGYRLNSVRRSKTSKAFEKGSKRWLYTYAKGDSWDNKVYKGPYAKYLLDTYARGQKYLYEHQYETVKDLKMPTSKERIDGFVDVFNGNRARTISDLHYVQRIMKDENVGSKEAQNLDLKKLLPADRTMTAKELRLAYEVFNHVMEGADYFASSRVYKAFMSDKYDAMVDDNNVNSYNKAHDPIIIFNANEALKRIGSVKIISLKEIEKNYNEVKTELAKSGEKVKL